MYFDDKVSVGIINSGNLVVFDVPEFIFLALDDFCKRHGFLPHTAVPWL